jgi:hypothetical protein
MNKPSVLPPVQLSKRNSDGDMTRICGLIVLLAESVRVSKETTGNALNHLPRRALDLCHRKQLKHLCSCKIDDTVNVCGRNA